MTGNAHLFSAAERAHHLSMALRDLTQWSHAMHPWNIPLELLAVEYTAEWTGERFPDGRPKVPDSLLERMRGVTVTQAWVRCTVSIPLSAWA